MGLLVLLSFFTYALPTDDLGTRWEGMLALVLAVVATKFVVGDAIPRVWYRTLFDDYVSGL